jgi:hypothetical protein
VTVPLTVSAFSRTGKPCLPPVQLSALRCAVLVACVQVLHPAAMQPAIRAGKMGVRVKNSYNR